jgi:arylsulfatase A-like enzyme
MKRLSLAALAFCLAALPATAQAPRRNIIIFVSDGLRYGSVTKENMPNMFKVKTEGVDFTNSHSHYPTVTTANASVIATGHYIGDTGNFGNTLYVGQPMQSVKGSPTPFLENNDVQREMAQKFGGNYLNETSLLAAARAAGFNTAAIGKISTVRIQDLTAAEDGSETIFLDDTTGHESGYATPDWFKRGLKGAFLGTSTPATTLPAIEQQVYLMKATTRIVLPHFKESGKPFVLLYWCRDPDLTQHNARDSTGELVPGINGPSALAATRNADTTLGLLLAALKKEGLDGNTDIFLTADHGFITSSHESATSPTAKDGVTVNGVVAADLASALNMPLYDPARNYAIADAKAGVWVGNGAGVMGKDPQNPDVVVTANGGSDLIYLRGPDAKKNARSAVQFLLSQDYVSGVFVNDRLGRIPGSLPMSAVNLIGSAKTPVPDIYVNFRSYMGPGECAEPLQCVVSLGDAAQPTGQGSHGGFSRAETRNFMAAIGPDFKAGFSDPAPVSNADIAPTLARLGGIPLPAKGKLTGRVVSEALKGGAEVTVTRRTIASKPGPGGVRTILNEQAVGETRYFDAGGFAGKTAGLSAE